MSMSSLRRSGSLNSLSELKGSVSVDIVNPDRDRVIVKYSPESMLEKFFNNTTVGNLKVVVA